MAINRRACAGRLRQVAQAINEINQFGIASVAARFFKGASRQRVLMNQCFDRMRLPIAPGKLLPVFVTGLAFQLRQSEKQILHPCGNLMIGNLIVHAVKQLLPLMIQTIHCGSSF